MMFLTLFLIMRSYLLFTGLTEVSPIFFFNLTSRYEGIQCYLPEEIIGDTLQTVMLSILAMDSYNVFRHCLYHVLESSNDALSASL
jgi:hypothetical protein